MALSKARRNLRGYEIPLLQVQTLLVLGAVHLDCNVWDINDTGHVSIFDTPYFPVYLSFLPEVGWLMNAV